MRSQKSFDHEVSPTTQHAKDRVIHAYNVGGYTYHHACETLTKLIEADRAGCKYACCGIRVRLVVGATDAEPQG